MRNSETFVMSNKIIGFWRVGIYTSNWAEYHKEAAAWNKDVNVALAKAQGKIDRRTERRNAISRRNSMLESELNERRARKTQDF
jgi:hypothetical protein